MSGHKMPTDGGKDLGQSPFAALATAALPQGNARPSEPVSDRAAAPPKGNRNRGRVDILREKTGRGGKVVTVVTGFVGIGLPEKEDLAKRIQKACGVGGTVKEGRIEIQGDKRDQASQILKEAGFRPVFAGG